MSADIKAAHRELTKAVMGKPGVAGTAVGLHDDKPCLVVYLSDKGAERSMPRSVSGFRVVTKMSGGFRKL